MSGDERPPGSDDRLTDRRDVIRRLQGDDLEVLGLLPRSSNYTFLVRVGDPDDRMLAVYKPTAGETPLWDFPQGTLGRREVAAFLVSEALGWPWIPQTVLRDGPHGEGSVQLFVEFDPTRHYFTMREERPDELRRIALFDAVANNADRKSGHCLLSTEERVFAIDHGVCFHDEPKLRTVIWDFAGERLPARLADDLGRLSEEFADGTLGDRLGDLLDAVEIRATERRIADLLGEGRFPEPGPGRPYPWPIV